MVSMPAESARRSLASLVWIVAMLASNPAAFAADLVPFAPAAGEVDGWSPTGEAAQYDGPDLYELINGGAEVYHEYGFRSVLSQEYGDGDGHYVSLELYEMTDATAAWGIYSFRTGTRGETVDLGDAALLADYYLNLRRGRFFVTLSGSDDDEATLAGLLAVGAAVAGRLGEPGAQPASIDLLPVAPAAPSRTWYLAGDIALANLAPAAGLGPLRFTAGAVGDYGDCRLFLLAYDDAAAAAGKRATAAERLAARTGGAQPEVHLESVHEYLVITISADVGAAEATRQALRERLARERKRP